MKTKNTKLKDLINESVLGKLPSESMFKFNPKTGKFDAPKKVNEGLNTKSEHSMISRNLEDMLEKASELGIAIDSNVKLANSKYGVEYAKVLDVLAKAIEKYKSFKA